MRITVPFLLSFLVLSACGRPDSDYGIAYNVLYDGITNNYEVFYMDIDGTNQKNISRGPGVDWTYAAYEGKILFVSDRFSCPRCGYLLFEMDPNGNNLKKISDIEVRDSWIDTRNNGTEIIVNPTKAIDSAFYIIDRSNGELVSKVYTGLAYSNDPCFNKDGTRVIFRGGQTSSKRIRGFNGELYIINVDGSDLQQLTSYPTSESISSETIYRAGPPRLHPDGEFVSYQSYQEGKYSLFAVNLDGTDQRRLTDNAENEGWHAWSPDGKWLAIEVFDDEQTQFHIALMNWKSGELEILTDSTYVYQQAPVFVKKSN